MTRIVKSKCIICGICEPVCPTKAIREDDEENTFVIIPRLCNDCGKCIEVCPPGAIVTS